MKGDHPVCEALHHLQAAATAAAIASWTEGSVFRHHEKIVNSQFRKAAAALGFALVPIPTPNTGGPHEDDVAHSPEAEKGGARSIYISRPADSGRMTAPEQFGEQE